MRVPSPSRGGGPPHERFTVAERPEPAYLALLRSGELARRARAAVGELAACRVCPRDCEVDRLHAVASGSAPRSGPGRAVYAPKGAVCRTGRLARVASAFPHRGEEDCLSGVRGSGTIFFSFCNLRCVFCQNWDVSHEGDGVELRPEELAAAMLDLQTRGCHNVNLVTPEHVVPQVLEALVLAAEEGLRLPLVYNTSAYDSPRSLELLDGVVDVYMPDFKYWDPALARRYLGAVDYPEAARRALVEMHRQVGPLTVDRAGVAVRGVLLRHLVMPGATDDAREIFRFVAADVSRDTYVNVMAQYHPAGAVAEGRCPELCGRPDEETLRQAGRLAEEAGLWRFES